MENLAPAEPQARARLTDDQAQELVLRTVATHAESLLRVAYRHSLCADDAHDAYQRSMEILLRRAPTLDPRTIHRWLHVVVKHEAMEVREARAAVVATEDLDYDTHTSPHMSSPEEHALTEDRTTRAAEALRRLKPQELRTIWLKALGHSYSEISALTGFSPTNRSWRRCSAPAAIRGHGRARMSRPARSGCRRSAWPTARTPSSWPPSMPPATRRPSRGRRRCSSTTPPPRRRRT
jgi:DNA-directed RNA polymerase specialized sigma24 family protein